MLGTRLTLAEYLDTLAEVLERIDAEDVEQLAVDLHEAYKNGRCVFLCGNGGSGANASHFCEDLGKSTLLPRDFDNDAMPRLKVLSLTDNTPYILAWANDEGFDRVFVEQLKNLASPDDVLIAISGSGNSPNVLRAVEWANTRGLLTWGVTGFQGGRLRQIAARSLHVPLDDMGLVESVHLLLFHWILDDLHARINHLGRYADRNARGPADQCADEGPDAAAA